MFPPEVGDKLLEIHGVLAVVQRDLSTTAVERAEHQNRGRVAHTANLLRPRPEVEANLVGEIRRRNCGLRDPHFMGLLGLVPRALGEIECPHTLIGQRVPAPVVPHREDLQQGESKVDPPEQTRGAPRDSQTFYEGTTRRFGCDESAVVVLEELAAKEKRCSAATQRPIDLPFKQLAPPGWAD